MSRWVLGYRSVCCPAGSESAEPKDLVAFDVGLAKREVDKATSFHEREDDEAIDLKRPRDRQGFHCRHRFYQGLLQLGGPRRVSC